MAYEAIYTTVTAVEPHPNSDNGLKLVKIAGAQVITSLDYQVGDRAVFFPEGGKLSNEFLYENSEYRFSTTLDAPVRPNKQAGKSGLFDENGRVRSIKLRGEHSWGYMAPVSSFAYTGFNFNSVEPGFMFTELSGHAICERYVSPAQQRIQDKAANKVKGQKRKLVWAPMFLEHFDTANFKYNYQRIPKDAQILVTVKMHGTSGRTGNVLVSRELEIPWYKKALNKIGFKFSPEIQKNYETISGSRRVAFLNEVQDGYHKGTGFREKIHESFQGRLYKGETIYYEIVGYQSPCSPLFHHTVKKDAVGTDILKKYKHYMQGSVMEYSYNCNRELGENQIYVYRITHTNEDGHQIDLSYPQRLARCSILGLNHVPRLFYGTLDEFTLGRKLNFLDVMNDLAECPSEQFPQHISEGVVVEVAHPEMMQTFKNKAFKFLYLEGLIKEDPNHIDIEEVS